MINLIGSFVAIGTYLPLPLLGYLADQHGPVLLAALSLFFFVGGYSLALYAYYHHLIHWVMCFAFMLIGSATSSLYFSCLLTCAKIYPHYKGLSISAPVTCYGLSSLLLSQLLKLDWFQAGTLLDLGTTFKFFIIVYVVVGLFSWLSSTMVTIEKDIVFEEMTPLLSNPANAVSEKFTHFTKDHTTYLMLFSFFLIIGPLEMFITNMGSLVQVVSGENNVPTQVSMHSAFSTLARILLGGFSDVLASPKRRFPVCRINVLAAAIILGALSNYFMLISFRDFRLVAALSGTCYGTVFTLFPTVVAQIWGIEILGTSWGMFMISPASGSVTYGLLYAKFYGMYCISSETNCESDMFTIIIIGMLLGLAIVWYCWKAVWCKRGFVCF